MTRASPSFWPIAVALIVAGGALRYPAFGHDFAADDYAQLAMMEGLYPSERGPFSLFTFSDGTPQDVQRLMDAGFYPWWSHPQLRLSMMRPLGSALMWIDHGLFGRWALGYHLHSLLWWLALLGVSAFVLRRLLGERLALLALFLFLLDETHGVMMGWIANRNAMVAALLCLLALERHVRARDAGARLPPWPVLLLYVVALAVGEYALCMLAYFASYELIERREPLPQRLRALSPLLGLSLGFLALRSALGFGSYASDLYVDPTRTPLAFLDIAVERFPILMSDLTLGLRADWFTFGVPLPVPPSLAWMRELSSWQAFQTTVGWVGLVLAVGLGWLAARQLGRALSLPQQGVRVAWLAVGALLSAVPPLVTAPTTRSLVGPAWGLAALLAALVLLLPHLLRARRLLSALLCAAFLSVHLLIGSVVGFLDTVQMASIANVVRHTALNVGVDDAAIDGKRMIILSSAEPITPIYFTLVRKLHDRAAPRSTWLLSPNARAFELSRPAPDTLEIALPEGHMLGAGFESIFRTSRQYLPIGHVFVVDGMRATVLELRDRRPSRMRYQFAASLDDPRYVSFAATVFGLRPHPLPAVGERTWIGPPRLPTAIVLE